ncbi:Probable potassium transporter 13 [Linum perenne]
MDPESGSVTRDSRLKFYKSTLSLAYQSLGVVYGDLSISPIYVYSSTFSGRLRLHEEDDEILGVLSLVFWTLTLIPLCKYIIFVLGADDNGEGGTFALYSLLCRNARVGLLTASAVPDYDLSSPDTGQPIKETRAGSLMRDLLEKYHNSRIILLLVVLLGTSMVISDGILTPSMSVLREGTELFVSHPRLVSTDYAVLVTCLILVGLFALQHVGTHRVGFLFAPILLSWLLCISAVGIYNIIKWNPNIVSALSPYYAYNLFRKTGKDGWTSLGGIVLCITGAEAMFADLGHFSKLSIRIAFTAVVYPCLILAYMGEAAYLSKHKDDLQRSFHRAIPEPVFWPVFVVATLATVVGSQAIISATFSIISQCRALKCFPRVKIIHTSERIHGQIYIPEVNWILMVLCLVVVVSFRDTDKIGNAYGLAVITVMFMTTCLMFLVIVMVWKWQVLVAVAFVLVFGSIELLYLSSCLAKVHEGGWLPLAFSVVVLTTMITWHYGTIKKQSYESQNKICLNMLVNMGPNLGVTRVPGICLVYTNAASGVPLMFSHFVTNFPAFHRVLVFITFQHLAVPRVSNSQQFSISRIGPPELCLYRCIVRLGYKDAVRDAHAFECLLMETMVEFLGNHNNNNNSNNNNDCDSRISGVESADCKNGTDGDGVVDCQTEIEAPITRQKKLRFRGVGCGNKELEDLEGAREAGVAYMMGNTSVVAMETSSHLKKFVINILYGFLRQNCRRPAEAFGVPKTNLVEVGMVYHV